MSERFWSLKACPLFERLSEEELADVEQQCRSKSFPGGSMIELPGGAASALYLVVSGRIKVAHVTGEGKESILSFVLPGEIFGELAVLGENRNDDYLEAAETSTLIMIPVDVVSRLMQRHPEVSLAITKLIGLRRRRFERRLKNLLFHSARERLIHLLLDFAEDYGVTQSGELHLTIRLSHQELANLIGTTRETVTVSLGEMKTKGYLRLQRRRIILTQPGRLAAVVDRPAPVVSEPSPSPVLAPVPA